MSARTAAATARTEKFAARQVIPKSPQNGTIVYRVPGRRRSDLFCGVGGVSWGFSSCKTTGRPRQPAKPIGRPQICLFPGPSHLRGHRLRPPPPPPPKTATASATAQGTSAATDLHTAQQLTFGQPESIGRTLHERTQRRRAPVLSRSASDTVMISYSSCNTFILFSASDRHCSGGRR